jgi:hypothetical protein
MTTTATTTAAGTILALDLGKYKTVACAYDRATAPVTPEKRSQEERRSPWPWELFPLDFESLMNSRAAARPDRPVNGGWPFESARPILTTAVEAIKSVQRSSG